ncbi:uncharacterized protein LOC142993929 isoform X2 [Genypterus blacodes]
MYGYFLSAFSCLCFFSAGSNAEECSRSVLARRNTLYVPAGGRLLLSCVVEHCGEVWTGDWRKNRSQIVKSTPRHHLSNVTLSANQTRLNLNILNVNQSDEGFYGCSITWSGGDSAEGHVTSVNVTSAPTRSVLHRLLICTGAILCMPVILGLAYFMRSKVKRQPLPRATRQLQTSHTPLPLPRSSVPQKPKRSTDKATPKSRQKAELVYAAISHDAPQQEQATTEREHATVYSSLRLS